MPTSDRRHPTPLSAPTGDPIVFDLVARELDGGIRLRAVYVDDRLRAVIEAAAVFDLGEPSGDPMFAARGAMGEVFRLPTTTGVWAVKLLFAWNDPGPQPQDAVLQDAARIVGVRAPAAVRAQNGEVVAPVGERQVRVYEWVDLAAPPMGRLDARGVADAGSQLGRVHGLGLVAPDGGVDEWYCTQRSRAEWESLLEGRNEPWAGGLREAIDVMVDLDARTAGPCTGVVFGHCDFDPSNIVPRLSDGRLVVLDWENAGSIPADWELGGAIESWCCPAGRADAALVSTFLDGYRRSGGTATVRGMSSFRSAVTAFCNYAGVLAVQIMAGGSEAEIARPQLEHIIEAGLPSMAGKLDSITDVLSAI